MPTHDVLTAVARRLREAERTRTPVAPFAYELGEGDIDGKAADDIFGLSVAMNADGTIFVSGAPGEGPVPGFARRSWGRTGSDPC